MLQFHDENVKKQLKLQKGLEKRAINGNAVWANGDTVYYWTDARNFSFSGGGAPVPPKMLKAYLEAIPGREPGKTADDK